MMRKLEACQFYSENTMKQKPESDRLVQNERDKSPGLKKAF
jgi:hypothetical protein